MNDLLPTTVDLIKNRAREFSYVEVHAFVDKQLALVMGQNLRYCRDFKVILAQVCMQSMNAAFNSEAPRPGLAIVTEPASKVNR